MDKWSATDHEIISELIQIYAGTPVEKALIFKEQVFEIFDMSHIIKKKPMREEIGFFKEDGGEAVAIFRR